MSLDPKTGEETRILCPHITPLMPEWYWCGLCYRKMCQSCWVGHEMWHRLQDREYDSRSKELKGGYRSLTPAN